MSDAGLSQLKCKGLKSFGTHSSCICRNKLTTLILSGSRGRCRQCAHLNCLIASRRAFSASSSASLSHSTTELPQCIFIQCTTFTIADQIKQNADYIKASHTAALQFRTVTRLSPSHRCPQEHFKQTSLGSSLSNSSTVIVFQFQPHVSIIFRTTLDAFSSNYNLPEVHIFRTNSL
jgi:hypothetical protein